MTYRVGLPVPYHNAELWRKSAEGATRGVRTVAGRGERERELVDSNAHFIGPELGRARNIT